MSQSSGNPRACVQCGNQFVAYRSDRIYCSKRCKSRAVYDRLKRAHHDPLVKRRGGGPRRDTCHLGHPIETRIHNGTPKRQCWICVNARRRQSYLPGTSSFKDRLRVYGLTREDYAVLLEEQGGVCAICREPCATGQTLSVDHDHATGRVRGLLCRTCNLGIGHLRDDARLVASALEYLRSSV